MTQLNDVQDRTRLTAKWDSEIALQYLSIALAGEVGEFCNLYKKELRGDYPTSRQQAENRTKMIDELGDILYYVAALADALHVDLEAVYQMNVEKLAKRHGLTLPASTSSYDQPR